jgi:hypothetical protein
VPLPRSDPIPAQPLLNSPVDADAWREGFSEGVAA